MSANMSRAPVEEAAFDQSQCGGAQTARDTVERDAAATPARKRMSPESNGSSASSVLSTAANLAGAASTGAVSVEHWQMR